MDPVLGKYINLLQVDSCRSTWRDFLDKVEKLGYKEREDYIKNNTGNPSAYFKAEVANDAKVKKLRDKFNVSSFGVESIDPTTIVGKIESGLKVFLKETKEVATIGVGIKNEFGYVIIKENGDTVRRDTHEFIVLTEDMDIKELTHNPYAVSSIRQNSSKNDMYHESLESTHNPAAPKISTKDTLDESITKYLKGI